jgi:hypothetical protein
MTHAATGAILGSFPCSQSHQKDSRRRVLGPVAACHQRQQTHSDYTSWHCAYGMILLGCARRGLIVSLAGLVMAIPDDWLLQRKEWLQDLEGY